MKYGLTPSRTWSRTLFPFQTRSAWRYQPYTFIFPYPKPKAPQSQITVFQRGPLFWKVGVNVALGLGVADVCCRFGMAPFRIRPLHRYQICLDEICFLLNGLGDKIVRTWCCRGCGRRALGFMKRRRGETPHSYIRRD